MAFQITDDVLDLVATAEFLGKPAGSDVGEGTFTLPVLYALEGAEGPEVRRLLAGGLPYAPEAVAGVISLARAGGHAEQALQVAHGHAAAATAALEPLPHGPRIRLPPRPGRLPHRPCGRRPGLSPPGRRRPSQRESARLGAPGCRCPPV